MHPEQENREAFAHSSRFGAEPRGPLAKGLAAILAVVLLGVALMFSLIFVAVALGLGLIAWAWLWWKTRRARREFSEEMARMARMAQTAGEERQPRPEAEPHGLVIEGEVIEVVRSPSARDEAPH